MKKAKVDRIIKAKVAEAEMQARYAGEVDGRRKQREEFTLLLEPQGDGVCVLGERAKHEFIQVPIHPRYSPRVFDPSKLNRYDMLRQEYRIARFRAVMRGQEFGTGQKVIWYEYQFVGFG